MKRNEMDILFHSSVIADGLLRNINDNYDSVSFKLHKNGDLLIRFILKKRTEVESEYIDDMIAEVEALELTNCVKLPEIRIGGTNLPLENIVYSIGKVEQL